MAKDNISPEQKALLNLESKYRTRMWRIYNSAADEAAKLGIGIDAAELTEEMFSFENFPQTKKRINDILRNLHDDVQTNVISGAMASWQLANKKNDELVNAVFGDKVNKLTDAQKRQYFNNNSQALETFLSRKVNGMDLSKRVWNYTDIFKQNIEAVLDAGIREGKSASEMATSLKQYLKYPDKLFRRVRGEDGKLHLSKAAKAFHPGQGIYRSSYMNALRMSATENNIAYRTSDYLRIQGLDFVVGIRIRLSNNHTLKNPQGGAPLPLHDICDELQGIYPKTFKFTGWHPFCRCHQETVLKTEQEMNEDTQRMLQGGSPTQGSSKAVNDVPAAFSDWISENKGRLSHAKNLPYFVRDNAKSFIPGVKFTKAGQSQIEQAAKLLVPDKPKVKTALDIAAERHANRTKQQVDEITRRWQERTDIIKQANGVIADLDGIPDINTADLKKLLNEARWKEAADMTKVKKGFIDTLNGLKYVDDGLLEAKKYGFYDVVKADDIIPVTYKKIAQKAGYSSFDSAPLEWQKKKLEYEIAYVGDTGKKYKTWKLVQDTYKKKLYAVDEAIFWNELKTYISDVEFALSDKYSSLPKGVNAAKLKDYLAKLKGTKATFDADILKGKIQKEMADLDAKIVAKGAATAKPLTKAAIKQVFNEANDSGLFENSWLSDFKTAISTDIKKARTFAEEARSKMVVREFKPMSKNKLNKLFAEFQTATVEEIDKVMRMQTESIWGLLTDEEKLVLTKYTQTYNYLNERLRGLEHIGRSVDEFKEDLPVLTRALDKVALQESTVVRRGVYNFKTTCGKNLYELAPGDVFIDGGFSSTAMHKHKGFFYDYEFVIATPKGARGIYAEPFSHYNDSCSAYDWEAKRLWDGKAVQTIEREFEWIGQRGAKYRVVDKKGNTIYLELIGQIQGDSLMRIE